MVFTTLLAHQKQVISTLSRLFNETSEALGGQRANPAKKREIEDNSKKLDALFTKLNSGYISKNVADKLIQLCQALDNGDFSTALQIQVQLTTSDWDECIFWLAILKRILGGGISQAIQSVLSRLISAEDPPGSSAQENRRQCLKVLRVWLEKRIFHEFIIRHHIRELDALCCSSSSCISSRSLKTERAFDDPIRQREGMMVEENGSNSSIQLLGFFMPPMNMDGDFESDSDEENFEAVTPEHNTKYREGSRAHTVEKHPHILEVQLGDDLLNLFHV